MSDPEIAIRSIQHYLYCPHRWGLLEIGRTWAENYFVTRADLLHDRVHDPKSTYARAGRKVYTGVSVYNDDPAYNLYGVTDCIEAVADPAGIPVRGSRGNFRLCIVEYKPTQPKDGDFRFDDLMQVFAQKLCVDAVFGCDADAALYYADTKKRVMLPLRENFNDYDGQLRALLSEMRAFLSAGEIPPIRKKQRCSGCSMKDICMPALRPSAATRDRIRAIEKELL